MQGDKESGTPKRIVSVFHLLVSQSPRLHLCLPTVCTERTSIVVSFVTPSQIDSPISCSQHQFCRSSSSRSSRRARLISSSTVFPSHSPSAISLCTSTSFLESMARSASMDERISRLGSQYRPKENRKAWVTYSIPS